MIKSNFNLPVSQNEQDANINLITSRLTKSLWCYVYIENFSLQVMSGDGYRNRPSVLYEYINGESIITQLNKNAVKKGFFIPFLNFEIGGNVSSISDSQSSYITSSTVSSYKIKNNDSGFCKLNLGFEADIFKVWQIKLSYDYYEETTNVNNQEKQVQFTIRKKYF